MIEVNNIIQGDCLEVMKTMPENYFDAIITDPPAGISFMGKSWDHDKGGRDKWIEWMQTVAVECLRVIKPGGYALVWSIPRTSHWTATAWENGGFECRDRISHIFGSGFPKSSDISKNIDKKMGITPENKPQSELAKQWYGWGTALKPAVEDWWMFRKQPSEKTIADNVLRWGVGGINIDACRITHKEPTKTTKRNGRKNAEVWSDSTCGFDNTKNTVASADPKGRFPANLVLDEQSALILDEQSGITKSGVVTSDKGAYSGESITGFIRGVSNKSNQHGDEGGASRFFFNSTGGRFPSNLTLDEDAAELLDEQSGILKSGDNCTRTKTGSFLEHGGLGKAGDVQVTYGDCGGASRFFYTAKASRSERNAGLEDMPEKEVPYSEYRDNFKETKSYVTHYPDGTPRPVNTLKNSHPTVKNINLMRYLCRLVIPKNGVVLDPFTGSGSTCIAAVLEGFNYMGIEKETEYVEIANKRIAHWKQNR